MIKQHWGVPKEFLDERRKRAQNALTVARRQEKTRSDLLLRQQLDGAYGHHDAGHAAQVQAGNAVASRLLALRERIRARSAGQDLSEVDALNALGDRSATWERAGPVRRRRRAKGPP